MTNDDKQIKENYPRSYKCLQGIKCSIGLTRSEVIAYKKNFRDILLGRSGDVFRSGIQDEDGIQSIFIWEQSKLGFKYWSVLNNLLRRRRMQL